MPGIVRYGSYVPYSRLTRAVIGAGKGERAVARFSSYGMAVMHRCTCTRPSPDQ